MRSRLLFALCVVVALLGGALWWFNDGLVAQATSGNKGEVPQAARTAPEAPAMPAPTGLAAAAGDSGPAPCTFHERDGFLYRADLTTDNDIRPRALMAAVLGGAAGLADQQMAPTEHVHATGKWELRLSVARLRPDGGAILAARFANLQFTQGQSVGQASAAGDTAPAFLVQVSRRCAIEQFAWRSTSDLLGARTQQSLLTMSDFALPERPGDREYVGAARDERGTYDYRAALLDLNGGVVVAKRKSGYRPKDGVVLHRTVQDRVTGDGLQVRLAGGAWYEEANLAETLELGPSFELLAKSDIKLTSRLVARGPQSIAVNLDDGGWVWGNLLGNAAATRKEVDPKLVGIPFDAMLARIIGLTKDASISETLNLLAAWLEANPGQVRAVRSWIRDHGTADAESKSLTRKLMAALGMAGLPEARAALREFALDKNFNTALRVDAALNLATAKNFDKSDMDALLAMSREREAANSGNDIAGYPAESGTALLGAAAKQLREQGSDLGQKAIEELESQLGSEKDAQYLKGAILGAGNSGDPKLLPALQPFTTNSDPNLRLAAADALRLMPLEATAKMFSTWVASETHDNVKQALVHAMWLQASAGET
ncbi:MAG: HEAT repeat domain-containing protein, partial [Myxococcales bacterium]|nr:HEAT repeat domain-containing protein [Myxococcales bacterium]